MPMTANGLAKLLEELGELSQVAAKRLAYFHTSTHPDGAGDLDKRMEDEMADVSAAVAFVAEQFGLNCARIGARSVDKLLLFKKWHADPDNGKDCFHAPSVIQGDGKREAAQGEAGANLGMHWLESARLRVAAGEPEAEVLEDFGYVKAAGGAQGEDGKDGVGVLNTEQERGHG